MKHITKLQWLTLIVAFLLEVFVLYNYPETILTYGIFWGIIYLAIIIWHLDEWQELVKNFKL